MTYKEARVYLDKVSKYGSVLGLDAIRALLCELGNPQKDLDFVHIAGTNGKGSVLAYTSTILREAGYRTGRYISPTVVSYLERIQVDGKWISENDFADLVEEVQKAMVRIESKGEVIPTVFEAETAIAFLYFKKMNCDLVVLETGLGGALDATNIIENTKVCAFTSISRDHMGFLGNTLEQIAGTKAGIIKPGCSVVTSRQKPEVIDILSRRASELMCPMYREDSGKAEILEESFKGQRFSYEKWKDIRISLAGRHQIVNAVTALGVVKALCDRGYDISGEAVRKGFEKTLWPGRFTCLGKNPLFIIDGAHNEEAALWLEESVKRYFPGRRILFIMGMFKDKEYRKITRIMAPLAAEIYTVDLPDSDRTLSAAALKKEAEAYCSHVEAMEDVKSAVRAACASAGKDDIVLAFGSLSYLGKIMELQSSDSKVS